MWRFIEDSKSTYMHMMSKGIFLILYSLNKLLILETMEEDVMLVDKYDASSMFLG